MPNGAILAGMPRKSDDTPIDENAAEGDSSDSSQFVGPSPGAEDAQPFAANDAAPPDGGDPPSAPVGDVSAIEPVTPSDAPTPSEGADDRGTYAVPEWDPIGVVVPGQLADLAYFVVRSLGRGDGGHYDEVCADIVRQRQRDAGLAPSGIVSGETWALILPRVDETSKGEPVAFLKRLLGVTYPFRFPTEELKAFLVDVTGEENPPLVVNTDDWIYLIEAADRRHAAELATASES